MASRFTICGRRWDTGITKEYTYPIFTVDPTGVLWEAFIEKHHPPQTTEELMGLREERLIQILRKKQPIFNGVPELLKRLTKRFSLAIGSGYTHPSLRKY